MWQQHKYTNKLGYYWQNREITQDEQKRLYYKTLLNYYGFWINKIAHLSIYYLIYKRGFFSIPSDRVFWTRFSIISFTLFFSEREITKRFNQLLAFEIEDLHSKYQTQIDELRRDYLKDKHNKKLEKITKLQALHEQGRQVKEIMEDRH